MEKIGIFYGSTTGITESVAYRLAELMHVKEDIHDVARSKPSEIGQYELLLLGSSTWEAEIFKTTGMTSSTESKSSISKIKPLLYSVAETNL